MGKLSCLLFVILFAIQGLFAQETYFQTGHTSDILEVHFSPDDTKLASYSVGDGRLILWDVNSGRWLWMSETSFIRKGEENTNLKEFYWSVDEKTFITKSVNETYQTWDLQTGKILALTDTKPKIELLTPNKKNISYTEDNGNITISENGTTKEFKRFGNNSAFDTSNNGEMIAEGAGWGDASIKITNIKTGKSWFLDGHPSVIGEIVFSPDGKFIAVGGSDKNIYVFDSSQKILSKKLIAHKKPIKGLEFSPNGKELVSVDSDGMFKVWDWQSEKVIKEFKLANRVYIQKNIKFKKSDKYMLAVIKDELEIYDTSNWSFIKSIKTKEGYESKSGFFLLNVQAFL